MDYFSKLKEIFNLVEYTDNNSMAIAVGAKSIIEQLSVCKNKIFTIGNGGSAAIAAHTTIDLINSCGLKGICLSETAVITCIANDYGYEEIYKKNINLLADEGDILIAVSSSGKSPNILNAVHAANDVGCKTFTFTGFNADNPLRRLGHINVYVPVSHYGYVELIHQIILHMITDSIKELKNG